MVIAAAEKEPLLKQNINLLQINGTPTYEKWLDQIQPFDLERLDIMTKEKEPYVTEQGTTLNIQGFEKDEPTIQRINYIFVQGEKETLGKS